MKNCLILGGDGFIGSHLVEDLLQRGYTVKVFGRIKNNKTKNLQHVKKDIEIISGDFANVQDVEKALKKVDYVFHFISASTPASSLHKPKEEIELNVLFTINLLQLCVKSNIEKIVFPSSGGSIYGNFSRGKAAEEAALNPISPHAIGKMFIEQFLHYYHLHHKLDYIIYRISNIYGERQLGKKQQGIIPTILNKAIKKEAVEIYGNTIRDYIYVKDVTTFIASNFNKKHKYRIYNLGSGKGIKLTDLVHRISEQTKLKIRTKKLTRRPIDINRIILDTKRIREEFDFTPKTSLKSGIKKIHAYFRINSE